jgi:hypothetical protein
MVFQPKLLARLDQQRFEDVSGGKHTALTLR